MQNLVNFAVAYAKAGFSVLPMLGKKPLIKFADKPPLTVEEIEKFWKKHPYANIALKTTNFFVVDIDRHENGADGFKSLKDFGKDEIFRETLQQKTAGGGVQAFYLKREDMKIQQNIGWLPGVDIKAHENNYVVVAPSYIGDKKYTWLNKNPIATASKELVIEINKTTKTNNFSPSNYVSNGKSSATAKLFEQIVNGLGATGGRNNALASFIGGLLFRGVSAKEAYQLACIANGNTETPLSDSEVNRTFESMLNKEIRRREDKK